MKKILLLLLFPVVLLAYDFDPSDYKSDVDKIIEAVMQSNVGYERLEYLCNNFPARLSGTPRLESAINWVYGEMQKDGLTNVQKQEVLVPNWKRGEESAELLFPLNYKLNMTGLGGSIGTPAGGITAEVLVVRDKDELDRRKDEVKGKIVLFNAPFVSYGQTVKYRFYGAQWAAQYGAVASLIRSTSPVGYDNPHTGMMAYSDTIVKIPHAAITLEGAELLQRYQDNGKTPVVKLVMNAKQFPDAISHNVMGEKKGSTLKDEIISVGGHIDSWDVGQGAQDDGGGIMTTWEAVRIINELGLNNKRTIRSVMWTNEENGAMGGKTYTKGFAQEKHAMAFEFDVGTFPPLVIYFNGKEELFEKVKEFEPLLQKINPKITVQKGGGGVDISPLMEKGVPGMSLDTDDQGKYFWYHHSSADTFDKVSEQDFKQCVAAIAVTIYLYSNLETQK
jgi:carboxypeptidase Q